MIDASGVGREAGAASRPVAVLWDADGVLQHGRRDWPTVFADLGGPGFADALFAAEVGPVRGEEPLRDAMARLITAWRLNMPVEDLMDLWTHVELDQEAFALIADVRRAGTKCYLATNQQDFRVRFMRETLGYDQHFDATFYSSEMRTMKPERAYFERILTEIGAQPAQAVFIDDNAQNIQSARELGIRAALHNPGDGVDGLRHILSDEGVPF